MILDALKIATQGLLPVNALGAAVQGLLWLVTPPTPKPDEGGSGGYVEPLRERKKKRDKTLEELFASAIAQAEQNLAYERANQLARGRELLDAPISRATPTKVVPASFVQTVEFAPLNHVVALHRDTIMRDQLLQQERLRQAQSLRQRDADEMAQVMMILAELL